MTSNFDELDLIVIIAIDIRAMQDGGLEPDMSTYGGLLYSCGQGGLHKAAKKIHRHMLQSNVTPTADGFTGK